MLTIPEAAGDTSLLGILSNSSQLGTFRLEKPKLEVVLGPDGSNIEELIAKYLTGPSGDPLSVGLEIIDGTVSIEDRQGGQTCNVEQLQLSFRMSAEGNQPMALTASGAVPDGKSPGRFEVELKMDDANRLVAKTDSLSMEKLDGLLARFMPGTHLAGRLTSKVDCQWGGATSDAMQVSADADAKGLRFASPLLGTDRVQLDKLKAKCDFSWRQGKLVLKQANLDSDVGKVALEGHLELGEIDSLFASDLRDPGPGRPCPTRHDVARDAPYPRRHPRHSGELKVDLASRRGKDDRMTWHAHLRTSDLTAMRRGEELVWQQPIVVTLDARETTSGPKIERLVCESHFLTAQAAGQRENLAASLEFDLEKFAHRLDGFVDLQGVRMTGNGWANLNWRRDPKNEFELDADLQIRNLELTVSDRQPCVKKNLVAFLSSTGRTTFGPDTRLDTAELEIKAGSEHLLFRLAQRSPDSPEVEAGRWPSTPKASWPDGSPGPKPGTSWKATARPAPTVFGPRAPARRRASICGVVSLTSPSFASPAPG